ncbi:hypothetical protein DNL40_07660 [Xylanimonas oleitrophica]|uniref:Uncharacterized protein n=1 Tax=Xylanimonas oleitrophica TaxID=2607479 RepID=A0A2W5WZN0_9MICO|nr:hypothetical protein DNL40_07660 [Xylanimonas oleitrophica]
MELSTRPASSTPNRYEHSRVCRESATTEAEPSSSPVRRSNHESRGSTTRLTVARTTPPVERAGSPALNRLRRASTVTNSASP